MSRLARKLAALTRLACLVGLTPFAFSACGADGGGGPDTCALSIVVETATPEQNRSVSLRVTSSDSGFLDVSWSLRHESNSVDCSGSCTGETIDFVPAEPGLYDVSVSGSSSGLSCSDATRTVNVRAEGALDSLYDIVVTPLDGGAIYRDTINIPGGADFSLQELTLDSSIDVGGSVISGGESIAAHLRISPSSGGGSIDAFASPALGYAAQLAPDTFDIDVLPADATLAPVRITNIDVTTLGTLTVPPGSPVSGSVVAPGGAALQSARVFLTGGGLPSSIGTSTAAGAFDLLARLGVSDQRVLVSPPAGSGLPALSGDANAATPNGTIAVAYDDALVVSAQSFVVTESDGSTPIANARVTFISEDIPDAGAVSVDGAAANSLDGRVRVSAVSDAAGQITNLLLTAANYSVIVSQPNTLDPPTLTTRVVGGGGSLVLPVAAQPPRWTAQLVDELGGAIEGARVTVRPRGDLALIAGATQSALSDALGSVEILLAASGAYDVQVDPGVSSSGSTSGSYGRVHLGQIAALEEGETLDAGVTVIPRGQRVTGTIRRASGSSASAHVALYCRNCASTEVPAGEAVTEATGDFEITVPDSGTQ